MTDTKTVIITGPSPVGAVAAIIRSANLLRGFRFSRTTAMPIKRVTAYCSAVKRDRLQPRFDFLQPSLALGSPDGCRRQQRTSGQIGSCNGRDRHFAR